MAAPGLINEVPSDLLTQRRILEGLDEHPANQTAFDFDVAIVGLGYVGLPTALAFQAAGSRVLGVDVSERRLAVINDERADLLETDRERLTNALRDSSFDLTSDVARLSTLSLIHI